MSESAKTRHIKDFFDEDSRQYLDERYPSIPTTCDQFSYLVRKQYVLEMLDAIGHGGRVLDIGFHLSFAGIVTFPRANELKEVAKTVPLERLLLETDSPFLAPVPHRGKRNEPANVVRVAETIATLRGVDVATIGEAACTNFARLFQPGYD